MKRIGRYIFNGLTVLSLLLCVATVGLSVRSRSVNDVWEWRRIESNYRLPPDTRPYWSLFGYQVHSAGGELAVADRQLTPYGDSAPPTNDAELMECVGIHKGFFVSTVRDNYGSAKTYGYTDSVHSAIGGWGFYFVRGGPEDFPTATAVCIPYWSIGLLAGIAPFVSLTRLRRRRNRVRNRHCPICDYDLRATPERCPECGTVPEKAKA